MGPQQVIPTTTPPAIPGNRPAAIPAMIRPASDEHKVLIPQNPRPVQQRDPSTRQVISGGGNTAGKNDPTIQVNIKPTKRRIHSKDATEVIVTAGGMLTEDGGENRTYQLDRYNIHIGRDVDEPDIMLPYKWVSRKHARVSYDSRIKKYVIHNESDANPMEINGEVKLAAELNDGDVLTMGKTRLIFREPAGRRTDGGRASREYDVRIHDERRPEKRKYEEAREESHDKQDSQIDTKPALKPFQFSALYRREIQTNVPETIIVSASCEKELREILEDAKARLKLPRHEIPSFGITKTPIYLPPFSNVEITVNIPGLKFGQNRHTISLFKDIQSVEFYYLADDSLKGKVCSGWLFFWFEGILIADIAITILVAENDKIPVEMIEVFSESRSIFPSYSHKDENVVERLEVYSAALGDEYLRDVKKLRAGQSWEKELTNFIKRADVFQLFWSENAAGSKHVEKEWRCALKERETRPVPCFIRPVYWTPQPHPIPEELGDLHFVRIAVSGDSV